MRSARILKRVPEIWGDLLPLKLQWERPSANAGVKNLQGIILIIGCRKLAQKEFKSRHDWVGKVIHRELCKRLKFDHADKWCVHKPESVQENEILEIFLDSEIQTDNQIPFSKPDLALINKLKRTCQQVDFFIPAGPRVKIRESEQIDKCLILDRKQKKVWDMKVMVIPMVVDTLGTILKDQEKRLGNWRLNEESTPSRSKHCHN